MQHHSEQEIQRRKNLDALRRRGIEPYPAALYPVNAYAHSVKESFKDDAIGKEADAREEAEQVVLAGRLMSFRGKGKAAFCELQDSTGRIQLYVNQDELCPGDDKSFYTEVFLHLLDLGDFIGVKGIVFRTKVGEISIKVKGLTLLAKSLKPLPVVKVDAEGQAHDVVTDPEFRYRQRYADLVLNPQVRETFVKRTRMMNSIRTFLNEKCALEVDTPVLQPIPGGAAARPFTTHHNALDMPLYLRVANELYLKRLIVGGFDWVYEFSRNFRNEGMDRTHNPEFTVLEFYVAYKDYFWMMETTEQMLERVAVETTGSTELKVGDQTISMKAPFARISICDAIKEHTGHDVSAMNEQQLREVCTTLRIHADSTMGRGKLIDEIFGGQCEHHYVQPTFIIDYPVEMSPLTKKHRSIPGLVERFELMINGKEIANAYSELNDPIDQRERFEEQVKLMERGDHEAMYIDHDFLRALEYGMPPTSGIGFGIDRLCMLLTGEVSIQDVLLFPQMRMESGQ
ncbi:MAG: lysine--tRNA ligase [Flavobacteriales bacterium]|nr:lysine--tRNA ligase [Flavobacteriales bacterium]